MWKKWLHISLWTVLGLGTITVLVAAMQKKEQKLCSDIQVQIHGASNHVFVEKADVVKVLKNSSAVKGNATSVVNLGEIETGLAKNPWIKEAQLFFDNKQVLHVDIEEREPIARIFTTGGSSFYIDSSCKKLPLSDKLSARVPLFTSFPSGLNKLSRPDSLVLLDVKVIAQYIQHDEMLSAQVAQVDITPQRTYEIIPVVGNQLIRIGNAQDLEEKFAKLKAFYVQVWSKAGFEKYEAIDVQYSGQVVAVKRGAAKTYMDTLQAIRAFARAQQAMKQVMNDSTYSATISKQTVIVKDSTVENVKPDTATSKEKVKQDRKSTSEQKKQPKAVLKKH